jgi:thiol-disulfide isomerase/thioredoxin
MGGGLASGMGLGPPFAGNRAEIRVSSLLVMIPQTRSLFRSIRGGLAWLVCLAAPGGLRAEGEKLPLLKSGNDYYTNITVTQVTATDIYFSHSLGMGNAKLKSLDPQLQKQFGFDPVKAAEKAQQQAESNALYKQAARQTKLPARSSTTITDADEQPATAGEEAAGHQLGARSFLNQPAPLILADKWLTEQPNLNGKFVILDFWATWCAPCRRSIPHLNSLYAKFKDQVAVIGLTDENEEAVRKMTDPHIDYFVAIDTQHRSSSAVGITAIPHALLVDPKGIVRFEGHPGFLDEAKLEKLIARYGE